MTLIGLEGGTTHPQVMVILLSSYDEAEFADLTADCGAAAYVPKSAFGPDRLEAVWAAITSPPVTSPTGG